MGFFGRFSYATAVKYVCNIIVMWTGPQACLSLSSVVLDKDQGSQFGIVKETRRVKMFYSLVVNCLNKMKSFVKLKGKVSYVKY